MSITDYCHSCGHELYKGICTEDYCKCDCNGEDYED